MKIISHSSANTINIGKAISARLNPADIICLFGDLGSGKTVLTKGIAQGLGVKKEEVISPSFILMRAHAARHMPFYHFDLYRLNDPRDILDIGYEEYLYGAGVTVIEWADRLKGLLPSEFLRIELFVKSPLKRELRLSAFGKHYQELLKKIHESRPS